MGYDVSFNTLLFLGGIRSTWDSIEKCVSVSLMSAISPNTQPVETSSPPVCPGSDTQKTAKLEPDFVQNLTFDPVGALKMLSLQKRLGDLFVWRRPRWQSGGCSRWKAAKHVVKENKYN